MLKTATLSATVPRRCRTFAQNRAFLLAWPENTVGTPSPAETRCSISYTKAVRVQGALPVHSGHWTRLHIADERRTFFAGTRTVHRTVARSTPDQYVADYLRPRASICSSGFPRLFFCLHCARTLDGVMPSGECGLGFKRARDKLAIDAPNFKFCFRHHIAHGQDSAAMLCLAFDIIKTNNFHVVASAVQIANCRNCERSSG